MMVECSVVVESWQLIILKSERMFYGGDWAGFMFEVFKIGAVEGLVEQRGCLKECLRLKSFCWGCRDVSLERRELWWRLDSRSLLERRFGKIKGHSCLCPICLCLVPLSPSRAWLPRIPTLPQWFRYRRAELGFWSFFFSFWNISLNAVLNFLLILWTQLVDMGCLRVAVWSTTLSGYPQVLRVPFLDDLDEISKVSCDIGNRLFVFGLNMVTFVSSGLGCFALWARK